MVLLAMLFAALLLRSGKDAEAISAIVMVVCAWASSAFRASSTSYAAAVSFSWSSTR